MDDNTRHRRKLTAINPAVEALLNTLPVDLPDKRGDLRRWVEGLIGEVSGWANRKGVRRGMFAPPRLTRAQADAALRADLSRIGEAA